MLSVQVYKSSGEDHESGLFCGLRSNNLILARGDSPSFTTRHGLRTPAGGTEGFCLMTARVEMLGRQFERLTVLSHYSVNGVMYCEVVCSCRTVRPKVNASDLRTGRVRSCGCLQREVVIQRSTTHGMNDCPEHQSWRAMKGRCLDPNHSSYDNYGGRGISIYQPWIDDFMAFYTYVGPRPSLAHSIDRYPNKDGNYEPGNVRWATRLEQNNNRRPRRWRKKPQ